MKILVTAGSTRTMIDQVRCISNIFKGRTGFEISKYLTENGHKVNLITSNTDIIPDHYWIDAQKYRTYEELYDIMKEQINTGNYDVVIHSAAVSDYRVVATMVEQEPGSSLVELDSSGKIGSEHNNLFLKLEKTEKIVDRIRDTWGFKGVLVKFKLQVDMSDERLVEIATESMRHSEADLMVANCLEWAKHRAYIIQEGEKPKFILRENLPRELKLAIEDIYKKRMK